MTSRSLASSARRISRRAATTATSARSAALRFSSACWRESMRCRSSSSLRCASGRFGLFELVGQLGAVDIGEHLARDDLLAGVHLQRDCAGRRGIQRRTHCCNDTALHRDVTHEVAACHGRHSHTLVRDADGRARPALDPRRGRDDQRDGRKGQARNNQSLAARVRRRELHVLSRCIGNVQSIHPCRLLYFVRPNGTAVWGLDAARARSVYCARSAADTGPRKGRPNGRPRITSVISSACFFVAAGQCTTAGRSGTAVPTRRHPKMRVCLPTRRRLRRQYRQRLRTAGWRTGPPCCR